MKKLLCIALAAVFALSLMLVGCTPVSQKSPAEYKDIKWVTPDYSFRFDPDDDCKGNYTYNNTKYNIKAEFDGAKISVKDTDNDKELFYGEWMYEDSDYLYIHSIVYNTAAYEAFEKNYHAFYRLHQEKQPKSDDENAKEESK